MPASEVVKISNARRSGDEIDWQIIVTPWSTPKVPTSSKISRILCDLIPPVNEVEFYQKKSCRHPLVSPQWQSTMGVTRKLSDQRDACWIVRWIAAAYISGTWVLVVLNMTFESNSARSLATIKRFPWVSVPGHHRRLQFCTFSTHFWIQGYEPTSQPPSFPYLLLTGVCVWHRPGSRRDSDGSFQKNR